MGWWYVEVSGPELYALRLDGMALSGVEHVRYHTNGRAIEDITVTFKEPERATVKRTEDGVVIEIETA